VLSGWDRAIRGLGTEKRSHHRDHKEHKGRKILTWKRSNLVGNSFMRIRQFGGRNQGQLYDYMMCINDIFDTFHGHSFFFD
jgi:hypothetical protein